ncbi:MAG: hypothetical protein JW955_10690 [Sedimentisphaerales bacterium]|nr:hypothetical protein [Sedimentisphaerales bacterium]
MVERLPSLWRRHQGEAACTVRLRGKQRVDAVKSLLENHPRLQHEDIRLLSVADQLFFEEVAVLSQARTKSAPRKQLLPLRLPRIPTQKKSV